MIVYLSRSGPPEAMNCPVFMCDHCREPIQGRKGGDGFGGIVIWRATAEDGQEMASVHKGRCDRAYESAHPGEHWSWNDLDEVIEQLAHNTDEPFPAEDNVEYVAPAPSTWRQGHYRRSAR